LFAVHKISTLIFAWKKYLSIIHAPPDVFSGCEKFKIAHYKLFVESDWGRNRIPCLLQISIYRRVYQEKFKSVNELARKSLAPPALFVDNFITGKVI